MKTTLPINYEKMQYWFDGDKYLSSVMREEFEIFSKEFDLFNDPLLSLLPDCRHFARVKYLHIVALDELAEWCADNITQSDLSMECVSLFFCEETEQSFVKIFSKRFKEHVSGKSVEEVKEILINESTKLNGASFKRIAMKKWS